MSDDAVFMYYGNRLNHSNDALMALRRIISLIIQEKKIDEVVVYQSFKLPGFHRK